jgi:alginate O-acetyltransferase complex protein AlgI
VIVFFLCGLWHGASWTFVVWGLFHGLFLVAERLGLGRFLASRRPIVQHVYALLVVLVSWVIFRCESLSQAAGVLAAMVGVAHGSSLEYHLSLYVNTELAIVLAVCAVAVTPVLPCLARLWRHKRSTLESALQRHLDTLAAVGEATSLIAVFLMSLSWMAAGTYSPFLYFRF